MSQEFGSAVRDARLAAGLTQEDLAASAGLSVEGISLLERGRRRRPRRATLDLLIEALGLDQAQAQELKSLAAGPIPEPPSTRDDAGDEEPVGPRSTPAASASSRLPAGMPGRATAHQLPPPPAVLHGRTEDLTRLGVLLTATARPAVALVGLGGVGKSALALRAAHDASPRYRDGQLHLDMRGDQLGNRRDPVEALRTMMAALGVDPDHLPSDLDQASAVWRNVTAGRNLLFLLDNVADVDQVVPLLPSPGNAMLVTSRRDLSCPSEDLDQHHVEPLDAPSGRSMLRVLTAGRGRDDDATELDALADRCEGLPLALRLVAARLRARADWPAHFLTESIDQSRTTLIDLKVGDVSLRNTLTSSLEDLRASDDPVDQDAATLFCRLGVLPRTAASAVLSGAVLGSDQMRAELALERLADVSLVEIGTQPGTYVMHKLVHQVAGESATYLEDADVLNELPVRVLDLLTALAWETRDRTRPTPTWINIEEITAATPPGWDVDRCLDEIGAQASLWQALNRSATEAENHQFRIRAAQLSMGLITHFVTRVDTAGWPEHLSISLEAIAELGRPEEAWLEQDLALALSGRGEQKEARVHAENSERLARESGDRECLAWSLTVLSLVGARTDQLTEAVKEAQEAQSIAASIRDTRLEAATWRDLTLLYSRTGHIDEAIHAGEKSLTLYTAAGTARGVVMAQINLGVILRDHGHPETARSLLEAAADGAGRLSDQALHTEALDELGQWHAVRGNPAMALTVLQQALDLVDDRGGLQWEARIRRRLAQILDQLGRQDEAKEHWAAAAQVHLARGEWAEASEVVENVGKDDPARRLRLVPSQERPAQRSSG
ncbi:helix-turn-helix domain-containing protein [Dermacoccaceae bacterium W4C1]